MTPLGLPGRLLLDRRHRQTRHQLSRIHPEAVRDLQAGSLSTGSAATAPPARRTSSAAPTGRRVVPARCPARPRAHGYARPKLEGWGPSPRGGGVVMVGLVEMPPCIKIQSISVPGISAWRNSVPTVSLCLRCQVHCGAPQDEHHHLAGREPTTREADHRVIPTNLIPGTSGRLTFGKVYGTTFSAFQIGAAITASVVGGPRDVRLVRSGDARGGRCRSGWTPAHRTPATDRS